MDCAIERNAHRRSGGISWPAGRHRAARTEAERAQPLDRRAERFRLVLHLAASTADAAGCRIMARAMSCSPSACGFSRHPPTASCKLRQGRGDFPSSGPAKARRGDGATFHPRDREPGVQRDNAGHRSPRYQPLMKPSFGRLGPSLLCSLGDNRSGRYSSALSPRKAPFGRDRSLPRLATCVRDRFPRRPPIYPTRACNGAPRLAVSCLAAMVAVPPGSDPQGLSARAISLDQFGWSPSDGRVVRYFQAGGTGE